MAAKTLSLSPDDSVQPEPAGSAYLVLAADARRPLLGSSRIGLVAGDRVVVGRGDRVAAARDGDQLRIDTADDWMSTEHFKLTSSPGGNWVFGDLGSKNGTRVNGKRMARRVLADGDVIEAANTFFVFRLVDVRVADRLDVSMDGVGFVTLSPDLEDDFATIARVAESEVPIISYGASGTGKEVLARAVHQLSGRRGRFVAVNCGALASSLIESELFGAVRGAFSGADHDREGLVRASNAGTLFLDEIAELPAASQTKLLRVLEAREVLPVGGTVPVPVDLRVIAATHRDLDELVAGGDFRQDLYARLRGFELELPPLRDRREDLGMLIAALLRRIAGDRAGDFTFQLGALRALFAHDWPLNIRELFQALSAAAAICRDGRIRLDDLPKELNTRRQAATPPEEVAASPPGPEELRQALREQRGNVSAVARALRTSRSHVRRLARRFDIDLTDFRDD